MKSNLNDSDLKLLLNEVNFRVKEICSFCDLSREFSNGISNSSFIAIDQAMQNGEVSEELAFRVLRIFLLLDEVLHSSSFNN